MNKTKFFIGLSLFFFILSCILAVKLSDTEEHLIENIESNIEQTIETTENVGIEITTSEETTPATEETEVTTTEEIETKIETNVFETEEVSVITETELVEEQSSAIDETEEICVSTEEEVEISTEVLRSVEVSETETTKTWTVGNYEFTEEEVDLMANVLTHELGPFYYSDVTFTITYSDEHMETSTEPGILFQYHTKVLINQCNSIYFPKTLSGCISRYWADYLTNRYHYSHSDPMWLYCRDWVVYTLENGCDMPDNVFGATEDPYFPQHYTMYFRFAKIEWETQWNDGTYYYYARD